MKKVFYWLLCLFVSINYANAKTYVIGHQNSYADKDDIDKDSRQYLNTSCKKHCGRGYFYDRRGELRNGEERVCTKYPLKCGYECTYSWNIRYLVNNTDYTCQEAVQNRHMH